MIPWTVQQLYALKPGESMAYYRGRLDADIGSSPPCYADVLRQVRNAANRLCVSGILKLTDMKDKSLHAGPEGRVYYAHRPVIS